jgi:hypothetical protein
MPKPAQNSHTLATPPAQDHQDQELQESTGRRPPSLAQDSQGPELQENRELRPPSPPVRDQELQDNRELRPPSPPTHKDSAGNGAIG